MLRPSNAMKPPRRLADRLKSRKSRPLSKVLLLGIRRTFCQVYQIIGHSLCFPKIPVRLIDAFFVRELTFDHVTTAVSMGTHIGLSPGPSSSLPLVLSPSPRIAPGYDTGYFVSPPRASSSQYSSPMLPTPALSPMYNPAIGLEFGDVGVQMNPCFAARDWTQMSWQDDGTQFIG